MALTKVQQFYSHKSVFLTGATGTLGTVILYQLLVCFHDIGTIFVLIRDKKNESATQRLAKLLSDEIFQSIPRDQISKVKAVPGSVNAGSFTMGDMEPTVLDETEVVIHSAADVNFFSPLESVMKTNVFGTETLMKRFLSSSKIKAFIHVSTAFINPELDVLKEEVYKMRMTALEVDNVLKGIAHKTETRTEIEKRIIGKKITSYCFTKCLAENVVMDYSVSIPSAIVRVPIVSPCLHEPSPGYFNSFVGFNGIFVGAASGFMKYMCVAKNNLFHLAPVDICASHVITAAVAVGESGRKYRPLQVFNVANPNTVTWKQILKIFHEVFRQNPIQLSLWNVQLHTVDSWIAFHLLTFSFVLIPALVCDLFAMTQFKAPKATYICFKAYDRARVTCKMLQKDFKIQSDRALSLATFLQPEDTHLHTTFGTLDLKSYFKNMVSHLHKFVARQGEQSLSKGLYEHSRMIKMEMVRLLVSPMLLAGVLCVALVIVYSIHSMSNLSCQGSVPLQVGQKNFLINSSWSLFIQLTLAVVLP